ncbi:DUF4025 domain-containing protein [Paenibacillus nanensis]|uniref:DUF4025 domain-containing protein n=1 Tax=Paenibacillus nanensis TaxID=393251 RepID=UPI0013C346E5|nr:DUF4025 domain-containing protein [Paenibacillus nanensis]
MEPNATNQSENKAEQLQGSELTHEQFSDVYTAGTSDGIHQLADKQIKIENEPYSE